MSKGIDITTVSTGDVWRGPPMTLREYYAGLAMQGVLSNVALLDNMSESSAIWAAVVAVEMADALIAALQETTDA